MKTKKKLKAGLPLLLAAFMISSLTACTKNEESSAGNQFSQNERQTSEPLLNKNISDSSPYQSEGNILIAYFSRWGNTEYSDNVDASTSASIVIDKERFGTTQYVAKMIQETVGGDIHLIETAAVYTADFDELREVNHDEMADNILPELKESSLDISKYDTVFIGYPVWLAYHNLIQCTQA